jgi:Predicted lipoprotein involved in nitrous oxide reduction
LNLDKAPKTISVGDYNTKELINAETAAWVIGGKKPGVMTRNAKWAFAKKEDAEKFRLESGGRLAGFDEALEAAYKDLGDDTKMIREKRKMMKKKMLEKKG